MRSLDITVIDKEKYLLVRFPKNSILTYNILSLTMIKMITYSGYIDKGDVWDIRGCLPPEVFKMTHLKKIHELLLNHQTRDFQSAHKTSIVADTDLIYGFARSFELISEDDINHEIRAFKSYDEAIDWIKI